MSARVTLKDLLTSVEAMRQRRKVTILDAIVGHDRERVTALEKSIADLAERLARVEESRSLGAFETGPAEGPIVQSVQRRPRRKRVDGVLVERGSLSESASAPFPGPASNLDEPVASPGEAPRGDFPAAAPPLRPVPSVSVADASAVTLAIGAPPSGERTDGGNVISFPPSVPTPSKDQGKPSQRAGREVLSVNLNSNELFLARRLNGMFGNAPIGKSFKLQELLAQTMINICVVDKLNIKKEKAHQFLKDFMLRCEGYINWQVDENGNYTHFMKKEA